MREGAPEALLRPFKNKSFAVLHPLAITQDSISACFAGYADSLVMIRAASFRSFCSVDAGPSTPQPNHAVAPRSARIVTARIAGLSPGT